MVYQKIAPDCDVEDGCHLSAAGVLKDFLRREPTAHQAARSITFYTETCQNPDKNLSILWGLLIDALVQLPATKLPALIQLLGEIQKLPQPNLTVNAAYYGGLHFWHGLTGFGHDYADCE